jgi:hypothetical protein
MVAAKLHFYWLASVLQSSLEGGKRSLCQLESMELDVGRGSGPREKLLISICSVDGLVARRVEALNQASVAWYDEKCSSSCGKMCVSVDNSMMQFCVRRCHGYTRGVSALRCDCSAWQ